MKKLLSIFVFILISRGADLSAETLKLCGVEWPPFVYAEDEKLTNGITVDIFSEALRRLQVDFEADKIPYARCIKYVKNGKYDAVLDTDKAAPFLTGAHPISKWIIAVYVRNDFSESLFSWQGMKGKTVGIVRGYNYPEHILQFDGWKTELGKSESILLKKLHKKRHDYALLDSLSAVVLAGKLKIKVRMLNPPLAVIPLYLGFNKENADIAKRFDSVVEEMILDGTMDAIYLKYMPYTYTEVMDMSNQ